MDLSSSVSAFQAKTPKIPVIMLSLYSSKNVISIGL